MAQAVTDSNFDQIVTGSDKLVVIDFWAPWCGPCRMISPIVDALAEKYAGKADIVKCNVDESEELPIKFGIRNIPAILFIRDGKMIDRIAGAVSQAELENKINSLI
ncbi:MAG: thioredoxin [Bacteroidales bacterium]|nr:thioredoxin [Candidatus Cacconaster merdequi]